MAEAPPTSADDLLRFIDASPTPHHAVVETSRRLETHGYRRLEEGSAWELRPGDRVYVVRAGTSLIALELGTGAPTRTGIRLVGAHTDSPNLRVKPNPDVRRHGYVQLGVEVYGGVLLGTWLDRDLSLAGRVVLGVEGRLEERLVDFRRAMVRIPNLAIHLNRNVNTEGLVVNPQQHLPPVVALDESGGRDLRTMVAQELGNDVRPTDVLGFDLSLYDVQPAARIGPNLEFLSAPRLDNLASCHAALSALLEARPGSEVTRGIAVYDHEEVGSRSAMGAASTFLRACLERVVAAVEAGSDTFARTLAQSFFVSADMAHSVHPNYADRHEPQHGPLLGRGPVIKINANQSYATDATTWARFESFCRQAEVEPQHFVTRTDLGCGSTIGPITAASLGIRTVDVGNPMLAMHSCREMAAAADVPKMIAVLRAYFDEELR